MVEVGIRELKADLSGYLKRAAAGESIRVTMRGEPFVDLTAARAPSDTDAVEAALEHYVATGVITRAPNPDGPRLPSRRYVMSGSPTDDIIAERDRERRA